MPYPIAKAFLCSWFPLCHCVSNNSAKSIWVLMAGNQHLIVIWKNSLLHTKCLLPPSVDWHHNLCLHLWWVPQQWWKTLGDKLTRMNLYSCFPVCHSTAVLHLQASVHLALGSKKNPDEKVSLGCPSSWSPRDGGRALPLRALATVFYLSTKSPSRGGK